MYMSERELAIANTTKLPPVVVAIIWSFKSWELCMCGQSEFLYPENSACDYCLAEEQEEKRKEDERKEDALLRELILSGPVTLKRTPRRRQKKPIYMGLLSTPIQRKVQPVVTGPPPVTSPLLWTCKCTLENSVRVDFCICGKERVR